MTALGRVYEPGSPVTGQSISTPGACRDTCMVAPALGAAVQVRFRSAAGNLSSVCGAPMSRRVTPCQGPCGVRVLMSAPPDTEGTSALDGVKSVPSELSSSLRYT